MNIISVTEPRLIIYKSRRNAVRITVIGLLAGIAGALVLHYSGDDVLGWGLVIVAVITVIFGAGTLYDRRPQIVMTADGITDLSTIGEEVEWDAILHVDDFFYRGQNFVRLLLGRDYKPDLIRPTWFWRLDRIYGKEGVKAIYIKVSNLDINSMQLAGLIGRMIKSGKGERIGYLKNLSARISTSE